MISDESVEAARVAYLREFNYDENAEYIARLVLTAAAPYMSFPGAASVWDEAANVLYMGNAINQDHLKAMWDRNPYRSQA